MKRTSRSPVRRVSSVGRRIAPGSGNVFADLGDPNAASSYIKAEIAAGILRAIERLGQPQTVIAARLGVDPPTVSNLLRGRLERFSVERLLRFLNELGHDVDIVVRERPRLLAGRTRVRPAR